MAKIKLLTFSASYSFGAVLQCYALYKVLSEMGHDVELLRIPLKKSNCGFIGDLSGRINKLFVGQFKRKSLPRMISLENDHINDDDIYIVGSDQVWNPDITKNVALDYFFNFLPDNVKRISYAASFGNSEWLHDEIKPDVSECLQKFLAISVRESSGVNICKEVFNINSVLTLDPTLLLDNYDELLISKKPKKVELLVVFSFLKNTSERLNFFRYIGEKTNTRPMLMHERRMHKGISNIPWVTVEQWVSQIAHSSFVITDSFHCTVFAIIHRKQFIALPADKKRVGRILNLLDSLGLTDRWFPDIESVYKTTNWLKPIHYDEVFEKIKVLRSASINFLNTALNQ
ncbi:MAG: polysaccharide pyruvyl transferase family protein [Prolixibacteraceae bacterium]